MWLLGTHPSARQQLLIQTSPSPHHTSSPPHRVDRLHPQSLEDVDHLLVQVLVAGLDLLLTLRLRLHLKGVEGQAGGVRGAWRQRLNLQHATMVCYPASLALAQKATACEPLGILSTEPALCPAWTMQPNAQVQLSLSPFKTQGAHRPLLRATALIRPPPTQPVVPDEYPQ